MHLCANVDKHDLKAQHQAPLDAEPFTYIAHACQQPVFLPEPLSYAKKTVISILWQTYLLSIGYFYRKEALEETLPATSAMPPLTP